MVSAIEAVLPEMLKRRSGHLAAVSSLGAFKGMAGQQAYCASKAAINTFLEGLRIQLRSFDGVCRLVERNVGVGIVPETTARWAARTMEIRVVQLTDAWALRDLSICMRDYKALAPYARQLVDHMRAERREAV